MNQLIIILIIHILKLKFRANKLEEIKEEYMKEKTEHDK